MMRIAIRDEILDLSHPHVMGILNVTPDSFSDGGRYNSLDKALRHAHALISAGATIIDIGGESTRPGADTVSEEEESARVVPVVEAIAQRFEVFISVDTSKAGVMTESALAGAHLINDVRALQQPGALDAAVKSGLPVCLMHMQGEPHTMQHAPTYSDVMGEINAFFQYHIERCIAAGFTKNRLLLDPGFGFGKSLAHNYQILAQLSDLHRFGLPLVVGMSRKSMIGKILNVPPEQRMIGSVACAVMAASQGAHIIRAHDVKETVEAMRIVEATRSVKGD